MCDYINCESKLICIFLNIHVYHFHHISSWQGLQNLDNSIYHKIKNCAMWKSKAFKLKLVNNDCKHKVYEFLSLSPK